jgi:hypothetical protein
MSSTGRIERRDFITASGILTGLLAAGGPLSLIAPSRAWALDMKTLTTEQGTQLLSVARTIAPHDKLEDAAYALVVKAVDDAAATDSHIHSVITSGLQQLGNFARKSESERVKALQAMESSEFFKLARAKTLGALYSSPLAYAHFGYEGEAFSKGGYLMRGFDDLRWLPEVPLADSGPAVGTQTG